MEETAQTNSDLLHLTRWVTLTFMLVLIAMPRLQQLQKGTQPTAFGNAEALACETQAEDSRGKDLSSQHGPFEHDEGSLAQAGIESEIEGPLVSHIPGPIAPLDIEELLSGISGRGISGIPGPIAPLNSEELLFGISDRGISGIPGPIEPIRDMTDPLPSVQASTHTALQDPDSSSAQKEPEPKSKSDTPSVQKENPSNHFDGIIHRVAERYEVDPALVKAIIMAESSYNPKAVSRKGARGLMQLMPRTAKALGVEDSFDPEDNIDAGVRYFKQLLDQFKGNVKLAIAAYNAGSRKVRKYHGIPPFKHTRYYVAKVIEYHQTYQQ